MYSFGIGQGPKDIEHMMPLPDSVPMILVAGLVH
jgi:hypothetical protein